MSRSIELPAPGRGAYDRSLSRVQRDTQHRERLLLAATEVLEEGPATVARIVARAGVGRSTFYEFFDSPEHVVDHIEQRALKGLEAALELAFRETRTPLERLRAIARSWLMELEAHPKEARVVLTRKHRTDLLSPAGALLLRVLQRCANAARLDGMRALNADDDVNQLAAAAAIEAISRRHLGGEPVRDTQRTLSGADHEAAAVSLRQWWAGPMVACSARAQAVGALWRIWAPAAEKLRVSMGECTRSIGAPFSPFPCVLHGATVDDEWQAARSSSRWGARRTASWLPPKRRS